VRVVSVTYTDPHSVDLFNVNKNSPRTDAPQIQLQTESQKLSHEAVHDLSSLIGLNWPDSPLNVSYLQLCMYRCVNAHLGSMYNNQRETTLPVNGIVSADDNNP